MSEPLKKVRSGERLRIPASTYNAFIDAAQAHRNQQGVRARTGRDVAPDGTILVRNDTGVDQSQFSILGLNGPLFEPTNLQAFKNHPRIVKAIAPATGTHDNMFVVLAQPIAAGKMGRAYISGVYLAKVNVTDAGHAYATITDSETGYFTSGASGPVQILWKESGTGQKWAQIRLGGAANSGNGACYIAKVQSSQTSRGGGYYNCKLCTFDAADWDDDSQDPLTEAGDVVVVCNLAETNSTAHALTTGDVIICWQFTDDGGTVRYIGHSPKYFWWHA